MGKRGANSAEGVSHDPPVSAAGAGHEAFGLDEILLVDAVAGLLDPEGAADDSEDHQPEAQDERSVNPPHGFRTELSQPAQEPLFVDRTDCNPPSRT